MVEYTYTYSFRNISFAETRAIRLQQTGTVPKWVQVLEPGTKLPPEPGVSVRIRDSRRISAIQADRFVKKHLSSLKGSTGRKYNQILGEISMAESTATLDLLTYDNLTTTTQQYKDYLRDAARFISKHAGGIIGDHIKDHYFNAGKPRKWPGLSNYTIKNRRNWKWENY